MNPTAASFHSMDSQDEGVSWEISVDPFVTQSTPRNKTKSHFADDESSDSSLNSSSYTEGPGIEGSFPSAERIRIRWAKPTRSVLGLPGYPDDGRRRARVKKLNGEMVCTIRGRYVGPKTDVESIVMRVDYKGTCESKKPSPPSPVCMLTKTS